MDMETIEAITNATGKHLDAVLDQIDAHLRNTRSQRSQLLGGAFAVQLRELGDTVARIVQRLPSRALQRSARAPGPATAHELPPQADSRALTAWLIGHLRVEHERYEYLLSKARLGPAKNAVEELAALFLAQSKRLALEAHRFEDL